MNIYIKLSHILQTYYSQTLKKVSDTVGAGEEVIFFISDIKFKLCSYFGHFMMKPTANAIYMCVVQDLI
jgi:hypothetical protein